MTSSRTTYSDQQVQEILRRAIERGHVDSDALSYAEVVDVARQLDVDEQQVADALKEIRDEEAEQEIVNALRLRTRDRWIRQLTAYLTVNGGLSILASFGELSSSIAVWVAVLWGVPMLMRTVTMLRGPSERQVNRERKKIEKRLRKQARQDARRQEAARKRRIKRRREQAVADFDQVIEDGVVKLLQMVTSKVNQLGQSSSGQSQKTAFQEYVEARQRGEVDAQPLPKTSMDVRVDTSERVEVESSVNAGSEVQRSSRKR